MSTSILIGGQTTFKSLGKEYVHRRGTDGIDVFRLKPAGESGLNRSQILAGRIAALVQNLIEEYCEEAK